MANFKPNYQRDETCIMSAQKVHLETLVSMGIGTNYETFYEN